MLPLDVEKGDESRTIEPDVDPRCSYTETCTTGSPLRKVVSHVFGRNTLCTRQIPQGVWVHYCRKHYQRSRYRNPKGFALLQCDLIRKQLDRLELWGGVLDWTIKVRKREELRLSKECPERTAGPGVASLDGPESLGAGDKVRWSSWLPSMIGSGKTTADVLVMMRLIEDEISASGSGFPDVEILPSVLIEDDTVRYSQHGRGLRLRRQCQLRRGLLAESSLRARKGPDAIETSPRKRKARLPVGKGRRERAPRRDGDHDSLLEALPEQPGDRRVRQ